MRLLPEGKSGKLSAAALACAAVSLALAAKALLDLATVLSLFSAPAVYLSLAHSTVPYGLPPLAVLMTRHIRSFFAFAFLFWSSAFALSAGVWLRREWARRGAVWMLYLVSAAALLVVFFPWVAVPRPLLLDGADVFPEFNAAVRSAAFFARVLALLGGALGLWWALALERGALRAEFGAGKRPGGV